MYLKPGDDAVLHYFTLVLGVWPFLLHTGIKHQSMVVKNLFKQFDPWTMINTTVYVFEERSSGVFSGVGNPCKIAILILRWLISCTCRRYIIIFVDIATRDSYNYYYDTGTAIPTPRWKLPSRRHELRV